MTNFPRKLESKTTSLRIVVPENLDLALEGLIRKVLREQPKTDDIYSFAADYFETLLKIRDKAGAKYMSTQICSFHNDEDAHEMIKLANSFPKPKTASDERKNGADSGKSASSGKSPVTKDPGKVSGKRKRSIERIKSTTKARNKPVPGLVKPVTGDVTKSSPREPKVKDEKEDKVLTRTESNLQDLDEDEEFLKSDPIKELVERELMNKTTQKDINRDKGQSSTDMTEKEKLESEKRVDKVSEVIEPIENDKSKDELESKENRQNEALEGETTATGDELCAVVDALSIPLGTENETATNEKEENKAEVNLNEGEKEKTEKGGEAIETSKPETEDAVKVRNEFTPEKPEQVTDEKDLKEEKPEGDKVVKQEEGNEKKEVIDDEEKPKATIDTAEDGVEEMKEIKDKLEGDTEDKPKEDVEDIKNTEDIKGTPAEKEETDTKINKKEEETPKAEVEKTEDTIKPTEETSDISQANSTSVPDDSKQEPANEIEEKQEEETTNQTSLPEETSGEETTKGEISNEKPLTDSKAPIDKQEDEEIKSELITHEPPKTTEADNTPTTENKLEINDETGIETKEKVEEDLPKPEEIPILPDDGSKTTETDVEKPKRVNETQPSDKEDINQNEKPENAEENHFKDITPNDESLKATKEEVMEKEETKPQSALMTTKEDEEPAKSEPDKGTETVATEDDKKPDGTEKQTTETNQEEGKPDKPTIIVSTEEEPEIEKGSKVEEAKPIDEDKSEGVKLETEQLSNAEDLTEITETGTEQEENNNKESEESKQPTTKEEPSTKPSDGEILDEKAAPEVEVEATEGKSKPEEVKETEKLSAHVDTKLDEESIVVEAPDKDDKDSVKDERQKTPDGEVESQPKTDESQQTEVPTLKNDETKEPEITDNKTESKTEETTEKTKPEDTASTTETQETVTEATAEGELCSVVDTPNLTEPDKTNSESAKPEDGVTIKTITTHYYDLLQVPTTVTKEFKVHHTQDDSLTPHDLSKVGNTIIKSYQLVKGLTTDDDDNNNNNQQTVNQDLSSDIASENQTEQTKIESDIRKDETEDLTAIPTSANHSERNLFTMHELFLDSERKLSSYQKEETKFSSLKSAKQSLEDIKTESPKTPPPGEDRQEVEEIITKTVIPRIPEAVPDPPREVEETNQETNTQETEYIKDKKEDDKPETNSSDDSNEPTDSSNNGRSIDSDVPIISVEVRTVIETQILDDDEDINEDTSKGGAYRTELTLADGSNDVNVEVEATIQVPIETTDSENKHDQNLTDQEKSKEQTKQQTDKQEPSPEEIATKSGNEDGSSTIRDGSSGESDSTTLTAATEIKRFDSDRKNFARSSTQDLLTTQSLDSCKRPPLLKTRSLSVFRQGVTDFEIWNTIEKELEEAATKIQSKYRGYTVRKRLRREDAVQITTEESSVSTTPVEQEHNLDGDNVRSTGEFHDSIVLSIHPR